jgi:hypothetical protein
VAKRLNHWKHTIKLALQWHGLSAGTSGFTPNVQNLSTLINELASMTDGRVGTCVLATVRKGIWGNVNDPH